MGSKANKDKWLADWKAQNSIQPTINNQSSDSNDLTMTHRDTGEATGRKRRRRSHKEIEVLEEPDPAMATSQMRLRDSAIRQRGPPNRYLYQIDGGSGPQVGWDPINPSSNSGLNVLTEICKSNPTRPLGSDRLPAPSTASVKPFTPYQSIRSGHSQTMDGIHPSPAIAKSAPEVFGNTLSIVQPEKFKTRNRKGKAPVSSIMLPMRPRQNNFQDVALEKPLATSQYTSQANRPPCKVSQPQDLLIILDLNGTLIHRSKSSKKCDLRPGYERFLEYLFAKHTVMVWSSARPENVAWMCDRLFMTDQRALLKAEWGRDQLRLTPQQYKAKTQVYKRLEWVWECDTIAESHPRYAEGGRWGQSNTVLVEDNVTKAITQPHNLVKVSEFAGVKAQMSQDLLGQVVGYLEGLRWQGDVSSFIKQNPFRMNGG